MFEGEEVEEIRGVDEEGKEEEIGDTGLLSPPASRWKSGISVGVEGYRVG